MTNCCSVNEGNYSLNDVLAYENDIASCEKAGTSLCHARPEDVNLDSLEIVSLHNRKTSFSSLIISKLWSQNRVSFYARRNSHFQVGRDVGNRSVEVLNVALVLPPTILLIASICKKAIINYWHPSSIPNVIQKEQIRIIINAAKDRFLNHLRYRSQEIVKKALMSKSIKALYEVANAISLGNSKSGIWKIEFVEDTVSGVEGECWLSERKITLHKDLSDEEALTTLVFELTNAMNIDRHSMLYRKVLRGQMDRESYVKEIERIEHSGALLHRKVIRAAIKEMGWSKSLDMYQDISEDFETHWDEITNTAHADYYRKAWNRFTGAPEKHNL